MPEPLRVGVVPGVTPDKWVRVWAERMPGTPLTVVPVSDGEAGPGLLGDLDLVFARTPIAGVEAERLHVIPLWEETPVVVAAKDHPVKLFDSVTLADLADEDLRPGWDDAVLDLVAAGHGIARMPQSVLRATGRRDVVGRPIADVEPTRVGLAWLRDGGGPLVDEFIGIVRGRTANSSRGAPAPAPEPRRRDRAKDDRRRERPQRRR